MDQKVTMTEDGSDLLARALARCAAGERAALREIYESESARMIGVALRIVRRRELAEEVVQDGFVRIWQSAASYDATRGAPRAWLYTIIRNRALNIIRSEKRTDLVAEFDNEAIVDDAATPDAIVGRMADSEALRHCLEQLPAVRRNLILLAYLKGLSHGEIAGRVQMPLGTVKSWIRRSLLSLRECMA